MSVNKMIYSSSVHTKFELMRENIFVLLSRLHYFYGFLLSEKLNLKMITDDKFESLFLLSLSALRSTGVNKNVKTYDILPAEMETDFLFVLLLW